MSIESLHQSGLQSNNPALYQTIKDIIDSVTALQASVSPILNLTGGQIKFPNVQIPSPDVNTLDDYREGNWPISDVSGAGLALSVVFAVYIKIGSGVLFVGYVSYPANASALPAMVSSPPFLCGPTPGFACTAYCTSATAPVTGYVRENNSRIEFFTTSGVQVTNTNLSAVGFAFGGFYMVKKL